MPVEGVRIQDATPVAIKFILKARVARNQWVRDPEIGVIPMEIFIVKSIKHDNVCSFVEFFDEAQFAIMVYANLYMLLKPN